MMGRMKVYRTDAKCWFVFFTEISERTESFPFVLEMPIQAAPPTNNRCFKSQFQEKNNDQASDSDKRGCSGCTHACVFVWSGRLDRRRHVDKWRHVDK